MILDSYNFYPKNPVLSESALTLKREGAEFYKFIISASWRLCVKNFEFVLNADNYTAAAPATISDSSRVIPA
jgi:hypothetical protein